MAHPRFKGVCECGGVEADRAVGLVRELKREREGERGREGERKRGRDWKAWREIE